MFYITRRLFWERRLRRTSTLSLNVMYADTAESVNSRYDQYLPVPNFTKKVKRRFKLYITS